MVRVKVCGITDTKGLEACIKADADAVGFVLGFPRSPRNLGLQEARRLVAQVPPLTLTVAVTPEEEAALEAVTTEVNPDALQLYGPCRIEELKDLVRGYRLIKALPVDDKALQLAQQLASQGYDALLLDTPGPGRGGTGLAHNWGVSRRIRDLVAPFPVILAGGLHPGNVVDAIRAVEPYGVDASSRLESVPGVKDPAKVRRFVELVRRCG